MAALSDPPAAGLPRPNWEQRPSSRGRFPAQVLFAGAVSFLQPENLAVRTLFVAFTCVVLFSTVVLNPEPTIPTVAADIVSIKEVRRERDTLIVERPIGAREGAMSSLFVVTDDSRALRRVAVQYGRRSLSLIEVVSGLSAGDRIVVSDMHAWDAFDRVRMRSR